MRAPVNATCAALALLATVFATPTVALAAFPQISVTSVGTAPPLDPLADPTAWASAPSRT